MSVEQMTLLLWKLLRKLLLQPLLSKRKRPRTACKSAK